MTTAKGADKRVKVSTQDRAEIRKMHKRMGMTIAAIAKEKNLNPSTVGSIVNFRGPYKE